MTSSRRHNLMALAGKVVEKTLQELPPELRDLALEIPTLLFEKIPDRLLREGLDDDTLGLFEGGDLGEESEPGQARIYLFLENLFEFAERDLSAYADEVRITLLHELGHLLGFDEDALTDRGLD